MNKPNLLNTIKQWDNRAAQWMGRHFYTILFEIMLGIIFITAFVNGLKILDTSFDVHHESVADRLLLEQAVNSTLIVILLLLIALGLLNIINTNTRNRNILKNIEFNLSKRRTDYKTPQD